MRLAEEAEELRQENGRQLSEIENLEKEISKLKKQRTVDAVRSPDRTVAELNDLRIENERLQDDLQEYEKQLNEKDKRIEELEDQLEYLYKQEEQNRDRRSHSRNSRKNRNSGEKKFVSLIATPGTENDTPLSELSQDTRSPANSLHSNNSDNNNNNNNTSNKGIPKINVGNSVNLHELKEQESDYNSMQDNSPQDPRTTTSLNSISRSRGNTANTNNNDTTPPTGGDNESKLTDMLSPADSDVIVDSAFADENEDGSLVFVLFWFGLVWLGLVWFGKFGDDIFVFIFVAHQSRVTGMLCHPLRNMCVTCAHDGEIRLWSMNPSIKAKSKQVRCYKYSHVNGRALCMAFSPNGDYLCVGGGYKNTAQGMIYVFYIGPGSNFSTPSPDSSSSSDKKFRTASTALATTNEEGSLIFRHVSSDDEDINNSIIRNGEFHSVAFSKDGNYIFAGDNTGQITIYDVLEQKPVDCLNESSDVIHSLYPWKNYMFVCTSRMLSVIDLKNLSKLAQLSSKKSGSSFGLKLKSNIIYQTGNQSYAMKVIGICTDPENTKNNYLIIGNTRKLESFILPTNIMKDKLTSMGKKFTDKVDQKEMNLFTTVQVHNKQKNYFIAARKDNHTPKVFDVLTGKTVKGCKYRSLVAFVDFVYFRNFDNYCIICCQDYDSAGKGSKKPLPVTMKMWKFRDPSL